MHQPTLLNDDGTASMATMIMSSHHAFRRDIARFIRAIEQLKSGSHLDIIKLQDEWRNSYRAGIHGHHTAEDTSIFPDLKNKFPELSDAIQTLTEQHHHIDPLIEQIDHAIEDMSDLDRVEDLFRQLEKLLHDHLAYEESTVIPALRENKEFLLSPTEEVATMYAKGFSWSMQGLDETVVEELKKILPPLLVEKLPAARAEFELHSKDVWGAYETSSSLTPVPDRY